jgi:hypothetical protein
MSLSETRSYAGKPGAGFFRDERALTPVFAGYALAVPISAFVYDARADLTALIKDVSSNGLLRNAIAPALSARSRARARGYAVTKMIGVRYPLSSKRSCKSNPLSPGMCRSVIRHAVSAT